MIRANNKDEKVALDKVSQRQRLFKRLQKESVTTTQLREEEEILAPAARIYELRHNNGCNIKLDLVSYPSESGVFHRVGRYTLHPGKWEKNNGK